MSGHHLAYQYVSRAEWERLQRMAGEYSRMQSNMPGLIAQVRQQAEADIRRAVERSDEQQRRFDSSLSNMSEESRKAQQQLSKQLQQAQKQFQRDLSQQQAAFSSDMSNLGETLRGRIDSVKKSLEAQDRILQSAIDEERQTRARQMAEVERQMNDVDARITNIEEREHEQMRFARQSLHDAQEVSEAIEKLPHREHAPGELEQIEEKLASAATLLAKSPGAAIALAHECQGELTSLQVKVKQRQQQWNATRNFVVQAIALLEGQVAESLSTPLNVSIQDGELKRPGEVDESREAKSYQLDLGKWSGGELQALQNDIAALKCAALTEDRFVSQAELEEISTSTLPELQKRLGMGEATAFLNYSNHREKIRIADIIAGQLKADFYEITNDGGWVKDDRLGDLVVEAVNDLGEKSVVIIGSEHVLGEQPRITVEYLNYRSEDKKANENDFVDARAERVRQSIKTLGEYGVNIAPGKTEVNPEPDQVFRDVKRLREKGRPALATEGSR